MHAPALRGCGLMRSQSPAVAFRGFCFEERFFWLRGKRRFRDASSLARGAAAAAAATPDAAAASPAAADFLPPAARPLVDCCRVSASLAVEHSAAFAATARAAVAAAERRRSPAALFRRFLFRAQDLPAAAAPAFSCACCACAFLCVAVFSGGACAFRSFSFADSALRGGGGARRCRWGPYVSAVAVVCADGAGGFS